MSKAGDHSIVVSTKALPPLEEQEDGPMYVHFLPRKEYLEAGTPWIVHSRYGCHPVAHVQFESVQRMTTGEGQPPVAVCKCGVSNHHLQVSGVLRGYRERVAVRVLLAGTTPFYGCAKMEICAQFYMSLLPRVPPVP